MDARIKKLWVAALRSGNYKQGRGKLRMDSSFCCLGVLCDLHAKETGKGSWKEMDASEGVYEYCAETHIPGMCIPPSSVYAWAGLVGPSHQRVFIDGKPRELENHNDAGKTFEEIAKAIEEQL